MSAVLEEVRRPREFPKLPEVKARRPWLVAIGATWLVLVVLAAVLAPVLPLPAYGLPVGPPLTGARPAGTACAGT